MKVLPLDKPAQAGPGVPTDSLAYQLHAHVAGTRKGRPLTRIHASDVTKDDWCPRRHALMMATGYGAPPETLGTAQALAFGISIMVAEQIIRWAAGAGIAVGDWKCFRCGRFYTYTTKPDVCGSCPSTLFSYHEHRFRSAESGISGGIDLVTRMPGSHLDNVVEIKGLQKADWQALKMPLAEHRQRTNLYLRLIEESDDPHRHKLDTTEATVFYVTKGGYGQRSTLPLEWGIQDIPYTPFKEFTIYRDDLQTEDMSERASGLFRFIKDQTQEAPKGICPSAYSSTAQACPMVKACFGGKFGSAM